MLMMWVIVYRYVDEKQFLQIVGTYVMNRSVKKPLHLYTHDVTGKIYVVNR